MLLDATSLGGLADQPAISGATSDLKCYEMWLGGTAFQPYRFQNRWAGDHVELELVPEPHNRADTTAVACDYDGHRIGYLFSGAAGEWHDVVRAANRAGVALVLSARLHPDEFHDRDQQLVPRVSVPNWAGRLALFATFGLAARLEELLVRLRQHDPAFLTALIEGSWDEDYDRTVIDVVSSFAGEYPEFSWPTAPTAGRPRRALPAAWAVYLRSIRQRERDESRARRESERARRAAEREIERAHTEAQREAAKVARRERDATVLALTAQGVTAREIATRLGLSMSTVARVRAADRAERPRPAARHAGVVPPVGDAESELAHFGGAHINVEQARERLTRCRMALALQQAGATRAKIAAELGVGMETVKSLLRDARFYAEPDADPARLAAARRAQRAQSTGVSKTSLGEASSMSKAKLEECWRDASSLTLLDAWPA